MRILKPKANGWNLHILLDSLWRNFNYSYSHIDHLVEFIHHMTFFSIKNIAKTQQDYLLVYTSIEYRLTIYKHKPEL